MPNSLDFDLGDPGNFASPADEDSPQLIDREFFGAEFLGQRFFLTPSYGQDVFDKIGYHHLRWPGDHAETMTLHDHDHDDATPEETIRKYSLTFENFVNPAYTRGNGDPREGIAEMFEFAVENGLSFALVAPTARYAEAAIAAGGGPAAIASAAQAAAADMEIFLTRLFNGDFGEVPREFTIELGSEYYASTIWQQVTSGLDTDGDGNPDPNTQDPGNLAEVFGAVFAALAAKIDEVEDLHNHEIQIDGESQRTDINVAVQMGRFQEDANDTVHNGDYTDNLDFINAFQASGQDALDAVDAVIWHRYVTRWGGIENGIWDPVQADETGVSLTVSGVVQKWEDAAGHQIDLLTGFSSPSLSGEKHKLEHDEQSLSYILQLTTGLLAEGADLGSIFGIGSGQFGSYAFRDNVFIGGDLWSMMAESLPGKYVVETHNKDGDGYQDNTSPLVYDADGDAVTNTNDDTVNSYVFENEDEVVIFLVAKDFGAVGENNSDKLEYTLNFNSEFAFGSSFNLWDSGVDYLNGSGRHVGSFGESSENTALAIANTGTGSQVSVQFKHDYELIRITLDKVLNGTSGSDVLNGFDTADLMIAVAGDDMLYGFAGNDTLKGGGGADTLLGGIGDDILQGARSRDTLSGGDGNDALNGGGGRDELNGDAGHDLLSGRGGRDVMKGQSGNDTLNGGGGKDILIGGSGNDSLHGGRNPDTFVFADDHGQDTIRDFSATNNAEKIDLSAVSAIDHINDILGTYGVATQIGADVVIGTGVTSSILLLDVDIDDLGRSDFIF